MPRLEVLDGLPTDRIGRDEVFERIVGHVRAGVVRRIEQLGYFFKAGR